MTPSSTVFGFLTLLALLAASPAQAKLATFDAMKARDGKTASRFFDDNYDLILQDLAAGGGAYVDALGSVFGCPDKVQAMLALTVAHKMTGSALVGLETPDRLLKAVARAARTRKALVEQCRNIPDAPVLSSP